MPDQQKFAEFYSTIRSHFSSNTWDYEKFKNNKNNRSKVEFLMCHEASALKSEKKLQTTLILAIEIIVQPIIGRDIPSKSFENHVFSRNLDGYNY